MASLMGIGLILLAVGPSFTAQGSQQDDRSQLAERLARLAPIVESRQTSLRSFEFTARLQAPFEAKLRCFFQAPTSRACLATHEGIPVFVAAGDRILTYSPLDGVRQWQSDWGAFIGVNPDRELRWEYAVYNAGNSNARIEIDLASLVAGAMRQRAAVPLGGGQFKFEGYSEIGGRLEAWVEPARTLPYSRLRITDREGKVLLEVETLVANESIPPSAFQFPRFEDEIPLLPAPVPVTLANVGLAVSQGFADFMVRAGMNKPEMRTEMEAKLGRPVDWAALPTRDATEGQKLRAVVERHFGRLP